MNAPHEEVDLYALLGVSKNIDPDGLKQAWRKRVRAIHPDHHPGLADGNQQLAALNAAYDVLSDPVRRALYDQHGADAASVFFDPSQVEPLPPVPRPVERGDDLIVELSLSAAEAYTGGIHTLTVQEARICSDCSGTGWRRAGRACSKCDGGRIPGVGPFRVQVPGGVLDGQVLVASGLGLAGRGKGAEPGDLVVTVRVATAFRRTAEGVEVVVPIGQASPDPVVEVPLPGGGTVRVRLPGGDPDGRRVRLRGKGEHGGDLFARLARVPGPTPIAAVKLDVRSI